MIIDSVILSLEDKVYTTLKDEILTGKLECGSVLREIALSQRLDVSRTPIRGALHRLAEEGLVELQANKGATVLGISRDDIEDIYEIRIKLEGLAARLAAERMSEDDRRELVSTVELSEFYLTKSNDGMNGRLDSEFHSIIFKAAGSRYLCRILSELHHNIKAYRGFSLSNIQRAKKALIEHREILDAILARNGDEAERLTEIHIRRALENFKAQTKKI